MTIPRLPTAGEEITRGLAPLIQQLNANQEQQQRQQALEQQQQMQQQRIAAQFLAVGIQQPGFAKTEEAQQLEATLGIPGFSIAIEKARTKEASERARALEEFISGQGFDEATQSAIRASFTARQFGATAEVSNQLFQQLAPDKMSELDRANLVNLRARTAEILRRLGRSPTVADQQAIAEQLGAEFFPGVDYAGAFEAILKQRDIDPRRFMLQFAMELIGTFQNQLGSPTLSPGEALKMSKDVLTGLFPDAAETLQLTPEIKAQGEAVRDAVAVINGVRANGNRINDRRVNTRQIREFVLAELRTRYGPVLDEAALNLILDIAQRRARPLGF